MNSSRKIAWDNWEILCHRSTKAMVYYPLTTLKQGCSLSRELNGAVFSALVFAFALHMNIACIWFASQAWINVYWTNAWRRSIKHPCWITLSGFVTLWAPISTFIFSLLSSIYFLWCKLGEFAQTSSFVRWFPLLSLPVCLITYKQCKEKLDVGHYWGVNGQDKCWRGARCLDVVSKAGKTLQH